MNSEYSIELQAEHIFNSKTKEYFHEVLSSYINGNYRSALVMLWTVTVTDLVFKLQDLVHIYGDTTAEGILKDISNKQNSNKTSPQWEVDLVDLINDRMEMFETHEITNIQSLQKHRHLSAHPIIKHTLELYQPNKETTRAYIRNILESVLTKPPLASNKIFSVMINDLSEKKDLFPEFEDLQKYINSAYLKNMPISVIKNIFRTLWKFVFKLNNEDAEKNRTINLRTLGVLLEKNQSEIVDFMKTEEDYYGKNISLENDNRLEYFVLLSARYPKVYASIGDIFKSPISEKIKQNNKLHTQATFLYSNASDYINVLKNDIDFYEIEKDKDIVEKIVSYCKDLEKYQELLTAFIIGFNQSGSFNNADRRFDNLIQPYLDDMDKDMLLEILQGIQDNDQQYRRGQASIDHSIIKQRCNQVLGEDFDYSSYGNFTRRIRSED